MRAPRVSSIYFCVVRLSVLFQVCSTGAIDRRRWTGGIVSFFSWDEGEEEEAYFFSWCVLHKSSGERVRYRFTLLLGAVLIIWSKRVAEQRNNEKPVFPRFFFCMKRPHI